MSSVTAVTNYSVIFNYSKNTSGAAKRKKKKDVDEATKKLPKIYMFLQERELIEFTNK